MQKELVVAAKAAAMIDVGRRLKDLRERRGMPKEQVALALRMSAGNWAHYESGRNQLSVTMLPALADVYGMTLAALVADLFDGGGPCQDTSVSGYERQNKSTANYNYTESAKPRFGPLRRAPVRPRELVGAGR